MCEGEVVGMDTCTQLLVLGAGSFAAEIADVIDDLPAFKIAQFIESKDQSKAGDRVAGYPILWIDDLPEDLSVYRGFTALGTTHRQEPIEQLEALGLEFTTIIHPTAQHSTSAVIGQGTFISRGSIVAAHAVLGAHVVINRGCLIGHHVRIDNYVTISPGANVAGGSEIGAGTYIGMGAIILNGIRIGKGSIVGAGAVVTRDVPDHVQVMGIPARVTKTDIKGL